MGGALTAALGVALAVGLAWAGAGIYYFETWLGAGLAVGLGAFFIKVGRDEGRYRRESLRRLESGAEESRGR